MKGFMGRLIFLATAAVLGFGAVSCANLGVDALRDPITGVRYEPSTGKNPGRVVVTQETWERLVGLLAAEFPELVPGPVVVSEDAGEGEGNGGK